MVAVSRSGRARRQARDLADDDKQNYSLLCECGNRKEHNDTACDRCRYLDGALEAHGELISALRGTDGLSIRELVEMTGRWDSAIMRSLQYLMRAGRIRRYWRESEGVLVKRRIGGRVVDGVASNKGYWVYCLYGREGGA